VTTALQRLRGWFLASLAIALLGACDASILARGQTQSQPGQGTIIANTAPAQTTTPAAGTEDRRGPESRVPYTEDELWAFGAVGVAFAAAWFATVLVRERERWHEFSARKEERLLAANTEFVKAMTELTKALGTEDKSPTKLEEFLASLLRSTAEFIIIERKKT
jgi:hypothetical protein